MRQKKSYDFIILDCAPTLLVTDTLLISQLADATVYLTRANFTEKELMEYPKKLIEENKLKNVGFVLNGLGSGKAYGYGYGYTYGYKYGYNYGYGYGYDSSSES
jgi:Mrp family chromosome partitioning ATPase